jgi:hypothetical protein
MDRCSDIGPALSYKKLDVYICSIELLLIRSRSTTATATFPADDHDHEHDHGHDDVSRSRSRRPRSVADTLFQPVLRSSCSITAKRRNRGLDT